MADAPQTGRDAALRLHVVRRLLQPLARDAAVRSRRFVGRVRLSADVPALRIAADPGRRAGVGRRRRRLGRGILRDQAPARLLRRPQISREAAARRQGGRLCPLRHRLGADPRCRRRRLRRAQRGALRRLCAPAARLPDGSLPLFAPRSIGRARAARPSPRPPASAATPAPARRSSSRRAGSSIPGRAGRAARRSRLPGGTGAGPRRSCAG